MNLLKTSALNAIAVAVKMLTMLGLNKVLAVYVGPSGYAIIGQLQNAFQILTTFSSGAINTGVTRYTAEFNGDFSKQQAVWKTAGTISLLGSLLASLLIFVFNEQLASFIVQGESLSSVFTWFACALVFFVFNAFFLAVLNGRKEVVTYVIANILGSLLSLVIVAGLTIIYGLKGALISLAIYQSASFVITLFLCTRMAWFKVRYFWGRIDPVVARNLAKYTVMALTSAVCMPVSQMVVRASIGHDLGWENAGYWEAMSRLSAAYLMFVTSTLSVYYLPRLAELKTNWELRNEILQGYKVILPCAVIASVLMYVFRHQVIYILFSSDFYVIEKLFAYQMLGDVFKIASWILGYILTARAYVGLFVISEIIFAVLFVVLANVFTAGLGLEGVSMAHAVTYMIHLISMVIILRSKKII